MRLQELRALSSILFGHRYRLELVAALALAGGEGVSLTLLAVGCGVPASVYYPPLKSLLEGGLAQRVEGTGRGRRVFYAPTGVPVWIGLRRIVEDLGVRIDAGDSAESERGTR